MIPKKIHYCWFGKKPKPAIVCRCMESWKKYLQDYEIIEWNEDNFDINALEYTRQAYENKKWAFVSDYVRLYALYHYGGLYFDTDVEALKNMDCFLNHHLFTGFETKGNPVTAVMGCEKQNKTIGKLMEEYNHRFFYREDGSLDLTTNTVVISDAFQKKGVIPNGKLQTVDDLTVYPQIYFCPNNLSRIWDKPSQKSFTIHHFEGSWNQKEHNPQTLKYKIRRYIVGRLRNLFGDEQLTGARRKKIGG